MTEPLSPRSTTAILIERHGPPEAFVEREVPLPELGPDEVQVTVQAAGVNFADLLMRAGLYGTVPSLPYSPGFEITGEVVRVGSETSEWRVGDRVVALLRYGGYARDVVVSARQLMRCPESLTPEQAAAIPVVFLTAWVCLFEAARARSGETALVLGAGGGVGTAAVQLAVREGLRVIGTAGDPRKRAFVTDELGAEACFDSRAEWEPEVRRVVGERGIDVALDPVGGRATAACRGLLAPLGRLVFYGLSEAMPRHKRSWLRAARAWLRTPRFHPLGLVEPNIGVFGVHLLHLDSKEQILKPALEEIYRGVVAGELQPVLDCTFPLDRTGAMAAHRHLHARRNLGKVVLTASCP
ncbi:MAG: zinc-binding dehydrogenase [Gemmatimonadetes bacterium]|nr:zinc-binding dehydrogenase [Gemmatimonadota bacterium]